MTINEFLHKYHDYITDNENEAIKECKKANKHLESTEHGCVVVKHFPCVGYCLMLKNAAEILG